MSTDELEWMRDNLEDKITTIKNQIDIAKSESQANGEFSDIEWFNKARAALRISGNHHQHIIRELAKRSKSERAEKTKSFNDRFVDIVRERVDPELFSEIINEAKLTCQ